MQVEQATFTSANTHKLRGYHLVARSRSIDDELSRVLSMWSPSHASLVDKSQAASSLNVFPAGRDHVAFTRTIFGGPEYSGRGGLKVVTRILIFRTDQLAGFNGDLTAVVRLACARGLLHLHRIDGQQLPTVEFPETSITALPRDPISQDMGPSSYSGEVLQLLATNRQVLVIGSQNPLSLVRDVLQQTPPANRVDLSFSTGLNPSVHRPFRIQFLPAVDDALKRRLDAQGVFCSTEQLVPAV